MDTSSRPMFSIVVPMYNVGKYAEQCIVSIMNQTFQDFEAILVDDGATDNTPSIIDEYVKKCPERLKALHKKNGGLVSARQAGLEVATGKYILPVDGDDWLDSHCLERFKEAIDKDDVDMYCAGHILDFPDGKQIERKVRFKGVYYGKEWKDIVNDQLLYLNPNLWGKCYKSDFYRSYQNAIDPMIRMGEDGVVTYPMYAAAKGVAFLDDCLYYYRQVDTSMVHTRHKNIKWEQAIWRIRHLYNSLEDLENRTQWLVSYATHAAFNSIVSIFQSKGYFKGKAEIAEILDDDFFYSLITQQSPFLTKKEKYANKLLKNRQYLLLWLVSKIN